MRNAKLWAAALVAAGFAAAPALAAGPTPETVQKSHPNPTKGLFPNNQPVPPYGVAGANNEQAGLTKGSEPNAGHTGLNGSGGSGTGWTAPETSGSKAQ